MSAPRSSRPPTASAADSKHDPLAFPPFTRARRVRTELVTGILRSGRTVPDETFDEIYPDVIRTLSSAHWTPVRIAARAVELLRLRADDRVLDVGAGAGKFCIVAAAMSGARVRGVERQPQLAAVAREAVRRFGVVVDIADGSFDAEDPELVDAAYFFNPFTETIALPGMQEFAADRFAGRTAADVLAAERFLAAARVGMRVVTFCGFGGAVPDQYERLTEEVWDRGVLELWEKRGHGRAL
jgi:SAM-dependent methyltransferase